MLEINRSELQAKVQQILRDHEGQDQCITMYQLCYAATGIPIIPARKVNQTRMLRAIIAELQEKGLPVVHKSGKYGGYYLATDDTELAREADWHRKRALSSIRREKALRRISTDELLKQYEIDLQEQDHA